MHADEYRRYDAIGLADLVRAGEVTPHELLKAARERLRQSAALNAVVLDLGERAERQLDEGLPDAALSGVPFLLKDLGQNLAGTVTSAGSRLFRDALADHDSTLVQRYLRAGLVFCGKTNTPELGLATTTEPRLHGATHNPHARGVSPGGSSGGAAAAVAGGIVPVAHASDGGGSIRIPASACGLFGLKPTRGRVPLGPDELEGWGGLATAHVVSRSVRDSALLLDLTHGPETGSPYAAPPASRSYLLDAERPVGRLVIGVARQAFTGTNVDTQILDLLDAFADTCRRLGHQVVDASPAIDAPTLRRAHGVLAIAHVAATLDRRARQLGRAVSEADVERVTWENYQASATMRAVDYAQALHDVQRLGYVVADYFTGFDLLLTPTMATLPPAHGALDMMGTDAAAYVNLLYRMIAFTALFNDTGNPAMSLPVATARNGLPVGMQFVAPHGGEALLLRVGRQFEREGIAVARISQD